jgi:hypothetical protein
MKVLIFIVPCCMIFSDCIALLNSSGSIGKKAGNALGHRVFKLCYVSKNYLWLGRTLLFGNGRFFLCNVCLSFGIF